MEGGGADLTVWLQQRTQEAAEQQGCVDGVDDDDDDDDDDVIVAAAEAGAVRKKEGEEDFGPWKWR